MTNANGEWRKEATKFIRLLFIRIEKKIKIKDALPHPSRSMESRLSSISFVICFPSASSDSLLRNDERESCLFPVQYGISAEALVSRLEARGSWLNALNSR